jgi:hypothetical protein
VAAGGKIRAFHPPAQLKRREVRVVGELDQSRADLREIVRRDVGRHADGDTGAAIDQKVGHARRQHHGFGLGAVVIRPEGDGFLLDLLQHFVGEPGQPALGVAHRRGAVAVERAEVA